MAVDDKPKSNESASYGIAPPTSIIHHETLTDTPKHPNIIKKHELCRFNDSWDSCTSKPTSQLYDFRHLGSKGFVKRGYNDADIYSALLNLDRMAMSALGTSNDEKPLEDDSVCTPIATSMHLKDGCNDEKFLKKPTPWCASCKADALLIDKIKEKHKKELIAAKQEIITEVHKILSKYRQIATEAVEVAKAQQQQFMAERHRLYVETYTECETYRQQIINQQQVDKRVGGNMDENCNQEPQRLNSDKSTSVQDICKRLAEEFKCDQFNEAFMVDCTTKIKDSYKIFQDELTLLLLELCMDIKCNLTRRDAKKLIDAVLFTYQSRP